MVAKATGTFMRVSTKTRGIKYDRYLFYVPIELARDTGFPFQSGDKVQLRIEGDHLLITKQKTNP